ncbi:efflux transporter outer membrane subunit [Parachlamydia acanthamoebae]|uniref:efflux transporter outer membrane subunit n=1 Tax=Parachlamydia acanthamoebae TaxID=83552 RepID=UPI0007511603|nr:efflux transporter outer membrane subunit [Parachlamydia acanthamoebae]
MKMIKALFFLSVFLGGCTVGPKYEPPGMEMPTQWHSATEEGMNAEPLDCFLWWKSLNDPLLNSLIEQASLQNLDVQIAISRILEARAAKKGISAQLYPHIDGTINYGHVQYNNKILKDILGASCIDHHRKRNVNFFEIGFDAEWEIDLFGKTTHELNAARAEIGSSIESLRDLMVSLTAEIAKNYIEIRGSQHLLDIAKSHIQTQKETTLLTTGLFEAGFTSIIDQWQTEEQLMLLESEIPMLELSIEKGIHRLSILLGCPPAELFCVLREHHDLPELPHYKPLGIPSALLRNRPDIRRAERNLAASTEKVGSAMADLFPRFSLRGFIGDVATHLSRSSFVWFAGPQLLAPIFNSKLIQQDIDLNKIKTQQALYQYQKTVLEALEETENAIASYHHELEHNRKLFSAMQFSGESYNQLFHLYQTGFKGYLEVLVSQRSLLSTENAFLKSKIQLLMHYISLYKALGGGWETTCDDA